MNSPSEKLAASITERLVRERLFSKTDAKKVLARLAEGKLQAADWRAIIETKAWVG